MDDSKKELKVFVSYGHTETLIVKRIAEYLRSRGHSMRMDCVEGKDGILHSGDDWRAKLEKTILECDGVLACMSEHSQREGGVCWDELAVESTFHGGNFLGVAFTSHLNPMGPILHKQLFNMADWVRYKEVLESSENKPYSELPEEFRSWFEETANPLAEALEHPDFADFRGEMETILSRLGRPAQPGRLVSIMHDGLTGREWLAGELRDWIDTPENKDGRRLCVIWAGPGMGKSAFAAKLASNRLEQLAGDVDAGKPRRAVYGWAFCDREAGVDERRALKSLAVSLAQYLPEYRVLLQGALTQFGYDVDSMGLVELAKAIISDPLSHAFGGNHETILLVVDGLDEAGDAGGNELTQALAKIVPELPSWVRVVATSREADHVKTWLEDGTCRSLSISKDDPRNTEDIRKYIQEKLGSLVPSDAIRDALVEALVQESEGVFLIAEIVWEALYIQSQKGYIDLSDIAAVKAYLDGLPSGLESKFHGLMRSCTTSPAEYRERWRLAFGCLLARPELPQSELRAAMGWLSADMWDYIRDFDPFVEAADAWCEDRTPIGLEHRSVSEWLSGPQSGCWRAFGRDGAQTLGGMCFDRARRNPARMTSWEILNIEPLLEEALMREELDEIRGDGRLMARMLEEVEAMQPHDPAESLALALRCLDWPACSGLERARMLTLAAGCQELLSRPSQGMSLLEEACEIYQKAASPEPGVRLAYARALAKYAELATKTRKPGARCRYELAMGLYRGLQEELGGKKLQNDVADELAQTITWLATLYKDEGLYDEATRMFEEALGLRKGLYGADPDRYDAGYAWTLNSFSTFLYDRKSDPEKSQEMLDCALELRRARASRVGDATSKNDYVWSLGDEAKRLGDKGSFDKCAEAFQEVVACYADLAKNTSGAYRRNHAWALGRYAWALKSNGQGEGALVPLGEALVIWRQLAKEDPSRSAPDLANCLDYQSVVLYGLGRRDEAEAAWGEARRAYLDHHAEPQQEGESEDDFVHRIRLERVAKIPARYIPLPKSE